MTRLFGLLVLGSVGLVCLGQERISDSRGQSAKSPQAVPQTVERLAPSETTVTRDFGPDLRVKNNQVPYAGFGSVMIVNDGTIIIEIGGKETVEYADDDEETLTVSPYDAIAFHMDITGLALVDAGGEVFLDRGGKQIAERGLSPKRVFRTLFPEASAIEQNSPRHALAWFTGDLRLAFDRNSKVLTVRAKDTEDTDRLFTLSAPVVQADGMTLNENDEIALIIQSESTVADGSSNCSISCPRGSASINCSNSGCNCVCKSGSPSCKCTNAQ